MKKIASKIGKNTIYCGSNILAGEENNYHFLIKYDNQSSVYTLSFAIEILEDIKDLAKKIKKYQKDAIVSYNNNILNIVGSVTDKKFLPEIMNPLIDVVSTYLKEGERCEVCRHCKNKNKLFLVDNDGEISFYCDDCYKVVKKAANYKKEKYNKLKENVFLGFIGAFLGSIPGVLLWLVLGYLNIEPGMAGIIITMGSAVGYKKFARNIKVTGMIVSTIIGLFMVFIAHEIHCSIYIYNLYKDEYVIGLFDAYKAIPYYLNTVKDFSKLYNNGIITGFLLSIIGVFTSYSLNRQNANTYEIKKIGE